MAMNKKEKGQMEALRLERDMYRAMYVSAPVEPDVHKPEDFNAVNHGWIYNLYLRKAEKAAVNSVYHARGERAWDSHDRRSGWSQGAPSIYSTKILALRAMRYELSVDFAKKLALCDREIEAAEAEERDEHMGA